jgi:hypothetical protein|tara:strand:+ start:595 stop:897 length:303 start_codon:yes stop_codon:yes gene_type:complete
MVMETVKKARVMDDIRKLRKVNLDWILANRQELLENFPNKWVAVKNESVQLADDELFGLFKIMSSRGDAEGLVYYLCNTFSPPVIFEYPLEVSAYESGTI